MLEKRYQFMFFILVWKMNSFTLNNKYRAMQYNDDYREIFNLLRIIAVMLVCLQSLSSQRTQTYSSQKI